MTLAAWDQQPFGVQACLYPYPSFSQEVPMCTYL